MEKMIITDAYGTVSEDTWAFLKGRNITPAEWDELLDVCTDHAAARSVIVEFTVDGMYDSFRAMGALARRA